MVFADHPISHCFMLLVVYLLIANPHKAFSQDDVPITAFHYPPYMDESLHDKGLFCRLVAEAYRAAGLNPVFRFYPLRRSTALVHSGEQLCQLGTLWNFPNDSRGDLEALPVFYYRVVGFYLKERIGKITFKNTDDLKKYRIGVIMGSSDAQILKNAGLDVHEVPSMELIFDMLYHKKRFDMVTTVELSGLSLIRRRYPNDVERWAMTTDTIQGLIGQIVFSKKYPNYQKYRDTFKSGFETIRENGVFRQVFEKYYGDGKVPEMILDINRETYNIEK